ncbi:MAG: hypothetical protein K2W82_17740 [Candidatus Obscuribacterales bacterium]|nr:hypothetical protein [Candidatus Obscuribacterales bacterium]
MVKHTNFRRSRRGGAEVEFSSYAQSPVDALASLCLSELGYGGQVTLLTPTKIEVQTQITSYIDRTVFEGSVEDMQMLVQAATAAAFMLAKHRDKLVEGAAQALEQMPETCRGVALVVTNVAPLFLGFVPALSGLLSAAAVTAVEDLDYVREKRLNLSEVMAAVRLKLEGLSFSDALVQIQSAGGQGLSNEQLGVCSRLATQHGKPYAELLEAALAAVTNKLALEEVPELLAMAAAEKKTVSEIAQLLGAA